MPGQKLTSKSKREQQAAQRGKRALRIHKGTTPGPWVKWKGNPAVMQGPARENTPSSFGGMKGNIDLDVANCGDSNSERRGEKNARFIAEARQLVPEMGGDIAYLIDRLNQYRIANIAILQGGPAKLGVQRMRELLKEDGFEVPE